MCWACKRRPLQPSQYDSAPEAFPCALLHISAMEVPATPAESLHRVPDCPQHMALQLRHMSPVLNTCAACVLAYTAG